MFICPSCGDRVDESEDLIICDDCFQELKAKERAMNEREEQSYIQGSRKAWMSMLQECLRNLGYDGSEAQKTSWIIEREAAIVQLRDLCSEFGDNDWDERLSLSSVIENHLGKHLWARER